MSYGKFAGSHGPGKPGGYFVGADLNKSGLFRFGAFEIDIKNCELRHSGVLIDLPPQAFRILTVLVRRPNELVTREEIRKILWPGESAGDFDSRINFEIRKIRDTLRDDADRPRYV
jgi:DNA-binding winged helix-turn-helix (wHTH) protein